MAFRDRYSEALVPHFHAWYQRTKRIKSRRVPLITPKTRIATIGSCFAEELAGAMQRLQLNGGMNPSGLVYNTRSIRQEILQAFGEWSAPGDERHWQIRNGYISPFKHPDDVHPTVEALTAWSDELDARASTLFREADVIVITVGLIEAWLRRDEATAYRYLPHEDVFEAVAPRFHRLTVGEMLNDLEATRECIRRNSGAEIIVTVSPVPLHATFADADIRVANNESKSRIRAAVSEFVDTRPDVHYFHSYEIVTTAERRSDFMLEDGRHVSRRGVDYILSEFMRQFAGDGVEIPQVSDDWITAPAKTREKTRARSAREARRWLWQRLRRLR